MMKQRNKLWEKLNHRKNENQGVSIIMVIIAMAFVGVLVSIVMLATLYNFYMKSVDKRAKDNFYTAETALEEIRAGLQRSVSNAFSASYISILQDYGRDESKRDEMFADMYCDELSRQLADPSNPAFYDVERLSSFVTKLQSDSNPVGATVDADSRLTRTLVRYTDGVRLLGLQVSYTDEQGYVSMISTDFLLKIPDLNFSRPAQVPDILNYCIIANESLIIKDGSQVSLKGSVYGGKEGTFLNHNANLNISRADFQTNDAYQRDATIYAITNKNFELGSRTAAGEGSAQNQPASMTVDSGISLWANGINTYGGFSDNRLNLNLGSVTHLQDDLTISGPNNRVSISNSFIGYGNSGKDGTDTSSGIIINGTKTKLDMTGLDVLKLGGSGFISVAGKPTQNAGDSVDESNAPVPKSNEDIKTGSSTTSKAEQLAYLVPADYVGIDTLGRYTLRKNPVSYQEYMEFKKAEKEETAINPLQSRFKEVDLTYGIGNTPLSNYGASYEKVFYRSNNQIWVYYYLNFNSDYGATKFFQDYYVNNSDYLNEYINNYVEELKFNSSKADLNLYMAGNMITKVGNTYQIEPASQLGNAELETIAREFETYGRMFQSLTHVLNANYNNASRVQLGRDVYQNLIEETRYNKAIKAGGVNFTDEVTNKINAFYIRMNEGNVFRYDSAFKAGYQDEDLHLIVVDGDAEISADFTGIFLASGTITINGTVTVSAYSNANNKMADCFLAKCDSLTLSDTKDRAAVYYFVNGDDFSDHEADDPSALADGDTITASDLIIPENWVKY